MSIHAGRLSSIPGLAARMFMYIALLYAALSSTNSQASFYLFTLIIAYVIGIWAQFHMEHVLYGFMAFTTILLIGTIVTPWHLNENILGCMLALSFAGAVGYGIWPFVPFAILGLLYAQSRGALLAFGFTLLIATWRVYKPLAISMFIWAIVLIWFFSDGRAESIHSRLGVWRDTFLHLTLWGHGWGSFTEAYALFPVHTNMTQVWAQHAYSDALELVFELGIGVIPLWFAIIATWSADDWALKLILGTFMILSLTYFPLYIPILGHLFFLCLGRLSTGTPK